MNIIYSNSILQTSSLSHPQGSENWVTRPREEYNTGHWGFTCNPIPQHLLLNTRRIVPEGTQETAEKEGILCFSWAPSPSWGPSSAKDTCFDVGTHDVTSNIEVDADELTLPRGEQVDGVARLSTDLTPQAGGEVSGGHWGPERLSEILRAPQSCWATASSTPRPIKSMQGTSFIHETSKSLMAVPKGEKKLRLT